MDGVVLVEPLLSVANERSPLWSARRWYEIGDRLFFFTRVFESYFPVDARDPAVVLQYPRDRFVPRSLYTGMFRVMDAVHGRAEDIDLPLLMILARQDKVIDVAAAERFYETCPASRKRRVYMDHGGHVIPWDYGWEQAVEEIVIFVDEEYKPASNKKKMLRELRQKYCVK